MRPLKFVLIISLFLITVIGINLGLSHKVYAMWSNTSEVVEETISIGEWLSLNYDNNRSYGFGDVVNYKGNTYIMTSNITARGIRPDSILGFLFFWKRI